MKRRIIIALCVCGFGILCIPEGFALAATNTMGQDLVNFFHLMISLLSWVWILIASMAGKLMTNTFVYGEFINLDVALYKLRNIAKNFANFMIGALFLWTIVSYYRDKEMSSPSALVKKIVGFLLAAIAVQASWFLVGATLDISTILTASIGWFPSMVLNNDKELQAIAQTQMITFPKRINFDLTKTGNEEPVTNETKTTANAATNAATAAVGGTPDTATTTATTDPSSVVVTTGEMELSEFLDLIVPRHDSVAGPLVYIWLSVFHVQDYLTTTAQAPTINNITDVLATFGIKFAILVLFTFAMVILLVINVIRVVYLWLFIAFSPLIIVFAVLKLTSAESAVSDKIKWFNLMNMVYLIFTPVLYVAYMWLMLIMVVTMQRILGSNDRDGMFVTETVQVTADTIQVGDSSMTVKGELRPSRGKEAGDKAANTMTDLLLLALTLVMIRWLVYLAAKVGPDTIAKDAAEWAYDLWKEAAAATPIMKIGDVPVSMNSVFGDRWMINEVMNQYSNVDKQKANALKDSIEQRVDGADGFTNTQYGELEQHTRPDTTFNKFSDSEFATQFQTMLTDADPKDFKNDITLQNYKPLQTHLDTWVSNNRAKIIKAANVTGLNEKDIKAENITWLQSLVTAIGDTGKVAKFLPILYKTLTTKDYPAGAATTYDWFIKQKLK